MKQQHFGFEASVSGSGKLRVLWGLLLMALMLAVDALDQRNITASPGQTVTLPCVAPNNESIIVVQWNQDDLEEYVVCYRDDQLDPESQHPSFTNRVTLKEGWVKDGAISLTLRNVTTRDGGTYTCQVVQSGSDHTKTDLHVIGVINLSVGLSRNEGDGGSSFHPVQAALLSVFALIVLIVVCVFIIYRKQTAPKTSV